MSAIRMIYNNEKGFFLPAGLVLLAFITLLGITAAIVTTTDLNIGGNYKQSLQAFQDAEAGVQYAIAKIEEDLKADPQTFTFPTTIGTSSTLTYTVPTDFSFVISDISLTGVNRYSFRSTGSSGYASSTVEVVFKRDPLFHYGAFGDQIVDLKPSGAVYSYDSSLTPNPAPTDSTGDGDVGSNAVVRVYSDTFIDGDVGLGDDGLDPIDEADYIWTPDPIITGNVADVPRIDPDPLGAIGGALADDFVEYSTDNNNSSCPEIFNDTLYLNTGATTTLEAGNYYLTSIILQNGSTLNLDATDGDINIYLNGGLNAISGSTINLTGEPADLTIFSNSTELIDFKHSSIFKGTIYAPYATVGMKNNANAYGMIWANAIDMKNTGQFYFDTALKDKWLADTFSMVSWKEVLN